MPRMRRSHEVREMGNTMLPPMPPLLMDFDLRSMYPGIFGSGGLARAPKYHYVDEKYVPSKILKSGTATIVFWKDGTKTVVKLPEGDTPDDYSAFTAALAIKIFGTNSKVKKVMKVKTEIQKPKKGEEDEVVSVPAESTSTDE